MTKSKTSTPTQSNTIIAIDPGFDRVGLAILCSEDGNPKLLFSQCIETNPKGSRGERLFAIGSQLRKVIEKWNPTTLAVETLFFNTNISSAIGVAEARGVVIYEASRARMEIFEYAPQTIKIAVTGYGRASKGQLADMVSRLVNLPKKPHKRLDDEMDAIALGITHLATEKGI